MALCASCSRFDIQTFGDSPAQTRGLKLTALQQGVKDSDCRLCHFLLGLKPELEALIAEKSKERFQWIHLRMSEDQKPPTHAYWQSRTTSMLKFNSMHVMLADRNALFIEQSAARASREQEAVACRVLADPDSPAFRSGDVKGVYLGGDRSTERHMGALSKRLVECLQHPKCNRTISGCELDAMSVELPTRCIEIGQTYCRLRETTGERGAYVTLSHRWSSETSRSSTTTEYYDPTSLQVVNGNTTYDTQEAVINLPTPNDWMYLVIQETNTAPHPIHLHGHDFYILASGLGTFNSSISLQTTNPPRRDVAMLASAGYLVLAFQADNPGIWLMHCHIGWHTSEGFALQFVERYDEIAALYDKETLESSCETWKDFEETGKVVQYDSGI